MDSRVTKFLVAIMNGTDAETAINDSGVDEMKLRDVLTDIAGVWNCNTVEALLNYQNWANSSIKIMVRKTKGRIILSYLSRVNLTSISMGEPSSSSKKSRIHIVTSSDLFNSFWAISTLFFNSP